MPAESILNQGGAFAARAPVPKRGAWDTLPHAQDLPLLDNPDLGVDAARALGKGVGMGGSGSGSGSELLSAADAFIGPHYTFGYAAD